MLPDNKSGAGLRAPYDVRLGVQIAVFYCFTFHMNLSGVVKSAFF